MAQTVVGLFDNASEAQSAVQALVKQGLDRSRIDVSAQNMAQNTNASTTDQYYTNDSVTDSIGNFFSSLFGNSDEAHNHATVARRGSSVVTVHAQSAQEAQKAATILDQFNAIDVADRAAQFRTTATGTNTATQTNQTTQTAQKETAIPVIEEQLAVGKRTVETGGARIRSRVIEKPVEESLRLREEHVTVERNPVNRAATTADLNNFREGEFQVTESAEVPVVSKEARVVEEVTIGKEVSERTETVRDTVRRTDVEVEQIETDETKRRSAKS